MRRIEEHKKGLSIVEGAEHFLLEMEKGPAPLVHAAGGIVALGGESSGATRALEILEAGGEDALVLSLAIVRRVLDGVHC